MPAAFANRAASSPSSERATLSGALCTWMSIAPARSRDAGAPCAKRPTAAHSASDGTKYLKRVAKLERRGRQGCGNALLCMATWLQRKRLIGCRTEHPQLFQLLRRIELAPEIEGHSRRCRARRRENPIDEAEQRAGEILRAQPRGGRQLPHDDRVP